MSWSIVLTILGKEVIALVETSIFREIEQSIG